MSGALQILNNLTVTGATSVNLGSGHFEVSSTGDITQSAGLTDMSGMSITMTPKGNYVLIMFSAPFHATSNGARVTCWININGSNIRKMSYTIYSNEIMGSFQYRAPVTPGTPYTIKIQWGGTTLITQRGSTDSPRTLTVIDLY